MRTITLSLATLLLISLFTGCSYSRSSLYHNLTPELQGMADRPEDVKRNWAMVDNANLRMLGDDLGRTFYTNHPSRLSPYPVLSLTGNPW